MRTNWPLVGKAVVFLVLWEVTRSLLAAVVLFGAWRSLGFLRWARERRLAMLKAGHPKPSLWRLACAYLAERSRGKHLVRQWKLTCEKAGLTGGWGKTKVPPALVGLKGTIDGDFTARVTSRYTGVTGDDLRKHTDRLAKVIGCREVVVDEGPKPELCDLRFYFTDPIGRILPLEELPESPEGLVSYGVRADGSAATIVQRRSVLIGGMTDHGKSNCQWAMLADLMRKGVPTELYISDPKGGVEWRPFADKVGQQLGCVRVAEYVKTPADTKLMVKRVHNLMTERQQMQRGKQSKPTPANPLVVVILDELLLLQDQLKLGTAGELGQVLFTGRASCVVVWANTQLGHVTELGQCRNLFSQALCFATKTTETTDTILGSGAEGQLGALCSKLREPGVGYSASEGTRSLLRFRAALVDEDQMAGIGDGRVPEGMRRRRPVITRCAVYRLYGYPEQDGAGAPLLYIGKALRPRERFAKHAVEKPWWPEVDQSATELTWFKTEALAFVAEAEGIAVEMPLYNEQHNTRNPLRRRRLRVVA